VNLSGAAALSDQEVVDRWQALFKGHVLVDRWKSGEAMSAAELAVVEALIATWRERLTDISWFMVAHAPPCAPRHSFIREHRAVSMRISPAGPKLPLPAHAPYLRPCRQ